MRACMRKSERESGGVIAYLEKSCKGGLRLACCFYSLPRRLPIVQEQGVRLQHHRLRELESSADSLCFGAFVPVKMCVVPQTRMLFEKRESSL